MLTRQDSNMAHPLRPRGNPGLAAAFLVALAQFLVMSRGLGQGLVSSYPGIEYDGFDWVLQGLYVRALLMGDAGPPLLFLRSPVFVLVTLLDALAGSSGLVVLGVLCLAHFVSLAALLAIWKRLGASRGVQAALFVCAAASPYAYFRGYILADPLAIAGMLVSTRYMLDWFLDNDERKFRASAAIGLLAGLTQLYGLLPFLTGTALSWLRGPRRHRGWPRLAFAAGVGGLGAALLAAWNAAIPHQDVPTQFGLLRLSLNMADFYANVWLWYFGFLAPVALAMLLAAAVRPFRPLSPAIGFLAATTLLFAGLLFFYQSEEARFSWYYFPLVLCLAAAGLAWLDRAGWGRVGRFAAATSLLLLAGQSFLITPPDYWQPNVADARFAPAQTWLPELLQARPVDRLDLAGRCGARGAWCDQAGLPAEAEDDERRILADYIRLRTRQAAGQGSAIAARAAETRRSPRGF